MNQLVPGMHSNWWLGTLLVKHTTFPLKRNAKKAAASAYGAYGLMPSTFIITNFHPKDCSPYLIHVLIISPFHLIYFPCILSQTFRPALFIILCHCYCSSLCRCSCRPVSIVHMHLIHFPLTFLIYRC